MEFYIFLWLFLVVLAAPGIFQNTKSSRAIPYLIIPFLACIVAFRYNVGVDWANYKLFYYSGYAYDKPDGRSEPLFTLIRYVCYNLGFSHVIFFLINSLISLIAIYKAAKLFHVGNLSITFLVYFSLFFCNLQFNIVRTGIMASCMWLAFAYKAHGKLLHAVIWALIGCGFHYVGLILLPFFFVLDKRMKIRWFYGMFGVAITLYVIKFSWIILNYLPWLALLDRVTVYVDSDSTESYGLSMGVIFNIMFCILLRFFYNRDYNEKSQFRLLLNALLLNNVFVLSLNEFYTIVARVSQTINMTAIFLWPFVFSNLKKDSIRMGLGIMLLIYLFLFLCKAIMNDPDSDLDKLMIPYVFDTSQLYDSHY